MSRRVAGRRLLGAVLGALAVAAVAVILAGCGSGSGDLTGRTWRLTAITQKDPAFQGVVPASEQAKYTIVFNADMTFGATADCNKVLGTYKTDRSDIRITPGPATLVACPSGSYGELYARALAFAIAYNVSGDQLTLTLADGGSLAFTGSAAASPAASAATSAPATQAPASSPVAGLTGKAWELTALTLKAPTFQGVVPAAAAGSYTLELRTDGTFAARADCNQLTGGWTATADGAMTITPGPSTLVACPAGSLADLYVTGLTNTTGYALADGKLTLSLADGGTLEFK